MFSSIQVQTHQIPQPQSYPIPQTQMYPMTQAHLRTVTQPCHIPQPQLRMMTQAVLPPPIRNVEAMPTHFQSLSGSTQEPSHVGSGQN